jgi:hypothetical protein
MTYTFAQVPLGAGGYLTGISIANDGSKIVRCDVTPGFIWDDVADRWKPFWTTETSGTINNAGPGWQVEFAPSNSNIIYLVKKISTPLSSMWKSTDKGTSWTLLSGFATFTTTSGSTYSADGNGDFKHHDKSLAVDPANPDHVLFGPPGGALRRTIDGGVNWTTPTGITAGSLGPGHAAICFDPSSSVSGGITQGIYAGVYGVGTFRSTDGGATWSDITGSGPVNTWGGSITTDGVWFVIDTRATGSGGGLWRYQSSTWTRVEANYTSTESSVACNPDVNGDIIISGSAGMKGGRRSLDYGATWINNDTWSPTYPAGGQTNTGGDIPWQADNNWTNLSLGEYRFDPTDTTILWGANGIGVWRIPWPTTWQKFNLTGVSRGIENMVMTDCLAHTGRDEPLFACWDRLVFRVASAMDTYPSTYALATNLLHTWAISVAPDDADFVVMRTTGKFNAVSDNSAKSTDGGLTWTDITNLSTQMGGSVAVSTSSNFIMSGGTATQPPQYTTDGGATWNSPTGLPTDNFAWCFNAGQTHPYCADALVANKFYAVAMGSSNPGTFVSTDSGANWTKQSSGAPDGNATGAGRGGARLRCAPGTSDLWWTAGIPSTSAGTLGPPLSGYELMKSINGGVNWSDPSGGRVTECWFFGFGKAHPDESYPAIYYVGWYDEQDNDVFVFGTWRSIDSGVTYTKLAYLPGGILDGFKFCTGDMEIYGRVYVGYTGNSALYGDIDFNSYLRPIADITDGTWTTQSGGTELYSVLDEATQDDADYARSPVNAVDESFDVNLGQISIAQSLATVRFSIGKTEDNDVPVDIKVTLLQGATTIASWTYEDVAYGFALKTETLSSGQLAALQTGVDIILRVTANPASGFTMDSTGATMDQTDLTMDMV